jgi:hypothetical protein
MAMGLRPKRVEMYLDIEKEKIVSFPLLNFIPPPCWLSSWLLCWLLCCCHIVVIVFIDFVAMLPTLQPTH